jgi:hypothetical protein
MPPGQLNFGSAGPARLPPHRRDVQERGGHQPPAADPTGEARPNHRPLGGRLQLMFRPLQWCCRMQGGRLRAVRSAARHARVDLAPVPRSPSRAMMGSETRPGGASLRQRSCPPT